VKLTLEEGDLETLALMIEERLRPLLSGNGKHEADDMIFNKKTLSAYLGVSQSSIDKMIVNKQIPYAKIGGLVRFSRKAIDKWVAKKTVPAC
jgi:excisionase family DNA binding protein